MSSSYRLELNRYLAGLDVKADTVIDIGGSQENIKSRAKSWQVKNYYIFDLEQPHADSPAPDVVCDLNVKYQPWLEAWREQADIIFCLEVFDYVYEPGYALDTIHRLLKPGGRAIISFPTVYPHHQPIEDDALRYMIGGIKKLAMSHNLVIDKIIPRRPETNAIDQLWRLERMRAAKHFDHNVTGYIVEFTKP